MGTICKYVEQRFMEHKRASDAANRSMAALDGCDQLVHCCLYFIAPHRIKPVDLMFMKKLHKMVPIIPIIAKSDTMTTDEKMNFKEEVRKELQKHEIVTFEFRQMVLEKMTGQVGTKVEPPWAVIGTKDGVVRDGELQDAFRKYDWGDADAADPRHSDLLALQTLLLGDVQQWIELKTTTNDKYEAWRTELLQKSRLRRLREAVVTTYQRLPPMLVLSFVVLLLSLLLVPTAHAALGDSSDSRVCCSRRDELEWQLREKAAELARARSHGFH